MVSEGFFLVGGGGWGDMITWEDLSMEELFMAGRAFSVKGSPEFPANFKKMIRN